MKTVLFGNGLNYMSENYIGWKQLLDKIKGKNLFENGKLPNTMIYERSIIENPVYFDTLTKKEEAIKKNIAEMLHDSPSNVYFDKLAELNVENYLTTNYDYASLEIYNRTPTIHINDKSTEGIYSIRRHKDIIQNGKTKAKIWHIHGEINTPASIMLGLDHYCGSLAKIDSYVKGRYEFQEDKKPVKTPSIIEKLNDKTKFDKSSWIELFFNSDVHIIGLSLDFSEIDLWWVLNKRARFKLDNQTKELVNNRIIYYSTSEEYDQHELLKSLNVEIIHYKVDGSGAKYHEAYNEILNQIAKHK